MTTDVHITCWWVPCAHFAHPSTVDFCREAAHFTSPFAMGRAYSDAQKSAVKQLLETGRDEEIIEKETGVSERTVRRWKQELERTGRIGKVKGLPLCRGTNSSHNGDENSRRRAAQGVNVS